MKIKYIFFTALLLGISLLTAGCTKKGESSLEYDKYADIIYSNIQQTFYNEEDNLYYETNIGKDGLDVNKYSYLWPLSAVFQGYVEKYKLEKMQDQEMIRQITQSIDQYYNTLAGPKPGYDSYVYLLGGGQRYYDDNQWIGLTYMDLFNMDNEEAYLKKAEEIYEFCMTGYDEKLEGGLYWRENDYATKNTCSNGPQVVLALELYQATDEKESKYLDTALQIYEWINKTLKSPEGVYWDNVRADGTIDQATYTYNTGIMIQANALLYNITGDKKYLDEAILIAESSLNYFIKEGDLPHTYWFNAVLLRGYKELYYIHEDSKYLNAFEKFAMKVWKNDRDEENLIGTEFPKKLIDQGAMLEIYCALAQINE